MVANASPSSNGSNGRRENGTFAPGYKGGPGNPYAARVGQLRSMLIQAVGDNDFKDIIAALLKQAKDGDLPAIREVLDRLLGKPKTTIEVQKDGEEEEQLDTYIASQLAELLPRGKASDSPPANGHQGNGNGKH